SGILFQDPAHNFVFPGGYGGSSYPSGYTNMQFMACFSRELNVGLYLAAEDNAGYSKSFRISKLGNDWLNLDHAFVPEYHVATDVTVPYRVKLGVFHGDWYDAALLYRSWAVQQPWTENGPLVSNRNIPDWLKKTGLMAWKDGFTIFSGPGGNAWPTMAQAASAWQQVVQSPPVIDWIAWEKQGPWRDIPDFLPPSQGWAAFDSAVAATHAAGGKLMVEPSTGYATVGAPSWSTLQAAASQKR